MLCQMYGQTFCDKSLNLKIKAIIILNLKVFNDPWDSLFAKKTNMTHFCISRIYKIFSMSTSELSSGIQGFCKTQSSTLTRRLPLMKCTSTHVWGCRCLPQRPAQEWLCCDAWRKEEESRGRKSSCPVVLSEPEGTKRKCVSLRVCVGGK